MVEPYQGPGEASVCSTRRPGPWARAVPASPKRLHEHMDPQHGFGENRETAWWSEGRAQDGQQEDWSPCSSATNGCVTGHVILALVPLLDSRILGLP